MIPIQKITGRLGNQMFQFAYLFAQVSKGKIPDFFLQDPTYFEGCELDIQKLFGEGIGFLNYTSIHVRRGSNPINPDEPKYSENPFYVNLSETDYYERAIALFPDEKFLIFSDDPEWCKTKFTDTDRFQVMEKGDEIEDFNLMASCKNNIIANSSYSWWAGWLNPNPVKQVVYPERWFSDDITRVGFPKKWTKI